MPAGPQQPSRRAPSSKGLDVDRFLVSVQPAGSAHLIHNPDSSILEARMVCLMTTFDKKSYEQLPVVTQQFPFPIPNPLALQVSFLFWTIHLRTGSSPRNLPPRRRKYHSTT